MGAPRALWFRAAIGPVVLAACTWITVVLTPVAAAGEWFTDLYLGAGFTQGHEVTTDSPTGETQHPDVHFNRSSVFGGRAGYWFDFVGLGLDISHFRPDTVPSSLERFDLYVTPLSLQLMVRWPLLTSAEHSHGQLQPYLAVGPAVGYVEGKDTTNFFPHNQYDAQFFFGGQANAGLLWEIRQYLGLFAEYRFTHFSPELDFKGGKLKTDLDTHYVLFGVSIRY